MSASEPNQRRRKIGAPRKILPRTCAGRRLRALGADLYLMSAIFGWVAFPLRGNPQALQGPDYPAYYAYPEAAVEIDRLNSLDKIHWRGSPDEAPPGLMIAPSSAIVVGAKVRNARGGLTRAPVLLSMATIAALWADG